MSRTTVDAAVLVVAKAPVPGRAKTRIGRRIGHRAAADLAAAALLDTLEVVESATTEGRRVLALVGDLDQAARYRELTERLTGWTVVVQRGNTFAERLIAAHHDAAHVTSTPVVQVGMDTPHLGVDHLAALVPKDCDEAVLGHAEDGGWWGLGLGSPALADALRAIPMSTGETGRRTEAALARSGARVRTVMDLRDTDTWSDAQAVARLAPETRFAHAVRGVAAGRDEDEPIRSPLTAGEPHV